MSDFVVPIIKKVSYSSDILLERTLPAEGNIIVSVDSKIDPFTKLGMTKVSYGTMPLDLSFKLRKGKELGSYFYKNERLGKTSEGFIKAPFNGYLNKKDDGSFVFEQEKRDYWLLSGVWGTVSKIQDKKSILLKTSSLDFSFNVCTERSFDGELLVFPNPSELLVLQYLENYTTTTFGKIIYVGNYASYEIVKKSIDLGVGAILAGGVDYNGFKLAQKENIFLGAFNGFGNIATPKFIFDILKEVSNRYVFVQGDRTLLRVPVPSEISNKNINKEADQLFVNLDIGMTVQIFEQPHFGLVGTLIDFKDDFIYVKVKSIPNPVKVKYPNIMALYDDFDYDKFIGSGYIKQSSVTPEVKKEKLNSTISDTKDVPDTSVSTKEIQSEEPAKGPNPSEILQQMIEEANKSEEKDKVLLENSSISTKSQNSTVDENKIDDTLTLADIGGTVFENKKTP